MYRKAARRPGPPFVSSLPVGHLSMLGSSAERSSFSKVGALVLALRRSSLQKIALPDRTKCDKPRPKTQVSSNCGYVPFSLSLDPVSARARPETRVRAVQVCLWIGGNVIITIIHLLLPLSGHFIEQDGTLFGAEKESNNAAQVGLIV